jgi:Tfp pilus assembly protein PilN
MSVAINLLPDIRQARLRSEHTRRLVTLLGALVCAIAVGIVIILLLLTGAQKLQLMSLNGQIQSRTAEVNNVANLTQALTAQQALTTLPSLYGQRTFYSSFLANISKLTPTDVFVSSLATDATGLMTLSGTGSSAASVDKFFQALSAANNTNPYFTGLTLRDVSKDNSGKASFSMTANVNPSATQSASAVTGVSNGN